MSSSTSFGSGTFGSGPLGTAPFYNVKTMIDDILYGTGHKNPASETTKRAAILLYMNNAYQEIVAKGDWRWMHASYDLSVYAPYTEGTISCVNGSNTVTGVGTAFNANVTPKGVFKVNSQNVAYRVLSVESATSLTLETKWAEDDIDDEEYEIQRISYQLPSTADLVKSVTLDNMVRRLVGLGPQDFRYRQALYPGLTGSPDCFSLVRRDYDDDGQYIEIFPAPDRDYNLHVDYTVRILKLEDSVSCYPIIPDRYRVVLFHAAMAQFQGIYMSDPTKAAQANADFMRVFKSLLSDTSTSDQKLVMKPERNYRSRPIKGTGLVGFKDRYTFGVDE